MMSDYADLIGRLERYSGQWIGSALISDAAAAIRSLLAERNEMQRRSDGWIVSVDRSDGPDASVAVVSRRVGSEVQILEVIEIPAQHSQEDSAMSDEWDYNDREVLTRTDDTLDWRAAQPSEVIAEIYRQKAEIEHLRGEVADLRISYETGLKANIQNRERINELKEQLSAERQRARMPDELVDRVRDMKQRGLMVDDQEIADLLRDLLAWHEQ
jgi:predicted RNase H-like nuclease (RuvC/YqgF family)